MHAALIYPHQLYHRSAALQSVESVYLIEDPLFFRQYPYHRCKLVLHRSSMKAFANELAASHKVHYVEASSLEDSSAIGKRLKRDNVTSICVLDPHDDWLSRALNDGCEQASISMEMMEDENFLTPRSEISKFIGSKDSLYFTKFYIAQRKRLNILIDVDGSPIGGKWSFDPENRRKLPKHIELPDLPTRKPCKHVKEAKAYVQANFPDAIGNYDQYNYPIDRQASLEWLDDFIRNRLAQFGDYEDAISKEHSTVFHSVLTPCLNIGLLTPQDVLDAVTQWSGKVPMNSLEGFIRQVIGWREYMRAVYLHFGRKQRTSNFWKFTRKLPASFYDGTTGIEPFDDVIKQVLSTGYCHHIERLMVLGNFMLLCRIEPNEVYRWFMELFVDAYDWVMVPNVYAMSQYADGGKITTKPYISGSAYILRMSNYKKGDWCKTWDALYWSFIDEFRGVFADNPRMSLMTKQLDRMGDKLVEHRKTAKDFLESL